MNKSVGVIVARFQTDSLSRGQMHLVDEVVKRSDRVLFFIGQLPAPRNATNPLPYEAIVSMVTTYLGLSTATNAIFAPIRNTPTDDVWSRNLDASIDTIASGYDVTLYCGRDGFNNWYQGKYPIVQIESDCPEISSTDRRADVGKIIGSTGEWRRGVIWAMENLPNRTYHTVDMALLKNTGTHIEILLAQKENETDWRFPGGFVEKGEKFAKAAAREMREETGLTSEDGWQILDDFIIDDWRVRGQKGVDHKTVLCVGWHMSGVAKASDDIVNVAWHVLDYVVANAETMLCKEHRVGMINAVKRYVDSRGPW